MHKSWVMQKTSLTLQFQDTREKRARIQERYTQKSATLNSCSFLRNRRNVPILLLLQKKVYVMIFNTQERDGTENIRNDQLQDNGEERPQSREWYLNGNKYCINYQQNDIYTQIVKHGHL